MPAELPSPDKTGWMPAPGAAIPVDCGIPGWIPGWSPGWIPGDAIPPCCSMLTEPAFTDPGGTRASCSDLSACIEPCSGLLGITGLLGPAKGVGAAQRGAEDGSRGGSEWLIGTHP
mmetsp:Transcript_42494/g.96032  ORF Transcript_42494/g.96032 Transcript_42494/m.96032 type:complete len:116 (+) Transcript_42494:207-554(+)